MPSYKIDLPTGESYNVESDKELSDAEAWRYAMAQHHAGGTQAAPQDTSSMLTKMAAYPAEQVGKIPYVGGALSTLVPSTPAGWGATAATLAAAPFIGPGAGMVPTALRAGAAALGGAGGSLAGGSTAGEAATSGAIEGAGQLVGEKVLGHVVKQVRGIISPIINNYGKALAKFIPGIETDKPDSTWFFNVVRGGEGNKALSEAFDQGRKQIIDAVGPDAVIDNRIMNDLVKKYRGYLPSAEDAVKQIPPGVAGTPAHIALRNKPLTVDMAITVAQEMGAAARKISPKDPMATKLRAAEIQMKDAVATSLDTIAPEVGQAYRSIQDSYRKGITILNILQKNADDIFTQKAGRAKINEGSLSEAMNEGLASLRKVGAGELQTVASRGGPPGSGASTLRLPSFGIYGGPGGGVHGRAHTGFSLNLYPGQVNPYLTGIPGQRIADIFGTQE